VLWKPIFRWKYIRQYRCGLGVHACAESMRMKYKGGPWGAKLDSKYVRTRKETLLSFAITRMAYTHEHFFFCLTFGSCPFVFVS
jgi:hypothetical protein